MPIFKQADLNWSLAPVLVTPANSIVVPEPCVILPQLEQDTDTEQDSMDTENTVLALQEWAESGVAPAILIAIQERVLNQGFPLVQSVMEDKLYLAKILTLDAANPKIVDAIVNKVKDSTLGTTSLAAKPAVPTTRLTPDQLDQQVTELMNKCL